MAEWLCSGLQLRVHRFDSVLSLQTMKILITGVAGFIGYHLAQKLLETDHEIVGIDNLNDYYSQSLKLYRLSLLESSNFSFYSMDINEVESLDSKFDLLINLAAQAGVRVPENKKIYYQNSNVSGFKKIMNYCKNNSIQKVIYASSSSVYDDSSKYTFSESETDLKPKSIYGTTKLFNETYANKFLNNLDCVGLRLFSVYGPLGRPDMAYYSFTDSLKKGHEIILHNKGLMDRDMTYIDDAVDGIICSINYLMSSENIKNEIFNIGNNYPISTLKLLKTLEKKLKINAKVKHFEVTNESNYTHANLSKSKKILGYNPKVLFENGIEKFLDWHQNYE